MPITVVAALKTIVRSVSLWYDLQNFESILSGPDAFGSTLIIPFIDEGWGSLIPWGLLIPEDIYIRLVPVLELASAMVDLSDEFMTRILCAPTLDNDDKNAGKGEVYLDPEYEVNEADRAKYKQFLCQLPDYQRVYFGHPASHFGSEDDFLYASCTYQAAEQDYPFLIAYEISGSFIDFYTSAEWSKFTEEHIRLVNFHFALVLVHEFAHGVQHARDRSPLFRHDTDSTVPLDHLPERLPEPLAHPNHCRNELGFAWEHYFFGALLALGDDSEKYDFTDPNTALTAETWDLAKCYPLGWLRVSDDIIRVLTDNIFSSNLATETLARVVADGTSLQLFKMAEKMVARGRKA